MLVLRMNSAGTVFVDIFRHIHILAIPDTDNVSEYQTVNRGKYLATGLAVSADKSLYSTCFYRPSLIRERTTPRKNLVSKFQT